MKNIIVDGNGIIYKTINKNADEKDKRALKKGVKQTLLKLSRKNKLFLLTDGKASIEIKKEFLKKNKVLKYFRQVLGTYQINTSKKKSPKAFTQAMKIWGIKKENTVFIGHDPREIKNAKKAGLKTITTNDFPTIGEVF